MTFAGLAAENARLRRELAQAGEELKATEADLTTLEAGLEQAIKTLIRFGVGVIIGVVAGFAVGVALGVWAARTQPDNVLLGTILGYDGVIIGAAAGAAVAWVTRKRAGHEGGNGAADGRTMTGDLH
jgi:hypothetical protein